MPGPKENKASMKGEAKHHVSPQSESVAGIEEHSHAGEQGMNKGVVFRLPKDEDCTDHSRVRDLD
jgi:hypothetical protein